MLSLAFAMTLTTAFPRAVAAATPAALAAGATVPAPSAPPVLPPDPVATELASRFAAVLKCEPAKKDPGRHLCALTRIGKDPIWTPGQASMYLGLSIKTKPAPESKTPGKADLKNDLALKKIGTEPVTAVALHLAAGSARIEPLTAASEGEKPKLQALLADLQNQLNGDKKDALVVPPELLSRLQQERNKPRRPLKLTAGFAELSGPVPVRLYRADLAPVLGSPTGPIPVFVTVETVADSQQLSIFPITPLAK